MNGSKHRPLGRGSAGLGGSIEGKIILVLVVIIVVLGATAFALYSTYKSQEKTLNTKQAEYDAMSANLSQITTDYATLNANYNRQTGDFNTVKANYGNVSEQYEALLNRTSLVDSRLNTFLENDPTVAYTYRVEPKVLPDNTTDKVLTVTAYNLGKTDAGIISVICTVDENDNITAYNKTFSYVRSLDKRQAQWEFAGNATILNVWAGLG